MPDNFGHYILFVTIHQKISYLKFIFCNQVIYQLSKSHSYFELGKVLGRTSPSFSSHFEYSTFLVTLQQKLPLNKLHSYRFFGGTMYLHTYLRKKSQDYFDKQDYQRDNATFLFNVGARLTAGIFSVYSQNHGPLPQKKYLMQHFHISFKFLYTISKLIFSKELRNKYYLVVPSFHCTI